jgi:LysM repeat protein
VAVLSAAPVFAGVNASYSLYPTAAAYNSQTLPILSGARAADPAAAVGGADITTVADEALVADSGPSGTMADLNEEPVNPGQVSLYVVRPDDTLSYIAEMFGVDVDTIRWANDLSGPIAPGDTLVILPVKGVQHKVKKGDTLQKIVDRYDGDLETVMQYNNITLATTLTPGMTITIPNGRQQETKSTKSKSSSSAKDDSGYYLRPVKGGVKTQGIHGYNAVDLAVPVGTPVIASASGLVEVSSRGGWGGGYGTYVVIDHPNDTKTLYGHLSSIIVDKGQRVTQGQVIGYSGSTGESTGPHLHFEVRGAKNPF